MKPTTKRIVLNDGSGGLNNRDLPGSLKQNEFSQLENIYTDEGGFPGKQIPGAQVIQYSTIDPEPFDTDADTALLLHLDEASGSATIVDASGNSRDLYPAGATGNPNIQGLGVFPVLNPKGQEFLPTIDSPFLERFDGTAQLGLDGALACTFEAWVYVKPSFSGAPTYPEIGFDGSISQQYIDTHQPLSHNFTAVYQTGAPVIATAKGTEYQTTANRPLVFRDDLQNGITLHQDYDATTGLNVGGSYCKFTIKTNGIAGSVNEIRTFDLPVATYCHVRGVYDSETGLASVYVNGTLQREVSVVGGGTINNSEGTAVAIGAWAAENLISLSAAATAEIDALVVMFGSTAPYTDNPLYLWTETRVQALAAAAYYAGIGDPVGEALYNTLASRENQILTRLGILASVHYSALSQATTVAAKKTALTGLGIAIDDLQAYFVLEAADYAAAIAHAAYANLVAARALAVASYVELRYCSAAASMLVDEVRVSTSARTDFPYKKARPSNGVLEKSDGTQQMVFPAGDSLFYTVGDGNYTLIKSGLSETAKWCWQQMGDILYGCNGVDDPIAWDGTRWVKWFEGNTLLSLQELGGGAAPVAGTYQYFYTYVYGTEETGPSPATTIVLNGTTNVIVTQIPTRHDNCSYIKVYRTKTGASVKYLLRQIVNNPNVDFVTMEGPYSSGGTPLTDSGSDGVADATLGTGSYTQITAEVDGTEAPNPKILTENFDRIFMAAADDSPYQAYWTEPGLADIVLPTSFVTSKGNRKISALSKSQGEVQAHKEGRGCLVLRGSEPSNWRQFDNLHPDLGAVDHFGIVYRTVSKQDGSGTDVTEVCMLTPQGWYGYQGYDFYRIDEPINGTFKTLAQANSTRLEYITTSQAQFQACENAGGGASDNIQASRYETDGLREEAGQVRIVNQLDYLGLWSSAAALVSGNVISVAKGLAEGEFWFSTDANNNLYRTLDNFQTVANTYAVGGSTERIMHITPKGSADFYFLFTDTAGSGSSSGGGFIYTWDNASGSLNTLYGTALYYDLDIPMYMSGNPTTAVNGRGIGQTDIAGPSGSSNNIYINHTQTVRSTAQVTATGNFSAVHKLLSNPNISTGYTGTVFAEGLGNGTTSKFSTVNAGFLSYVGYSTTPSNVQFNFDLTNLYVEYTRREFPRWRGGTFSPTPYWDNTNSQLVFLASTAENAYGNRATYLRTIDLAGTLTNQYTAENVASFTSDGTSIYFNTVLANTTILFGFASRLRRSLLVSPGTVAGTAALAANTVFLRMSYNSQATSRIMVSAKALTTGTQEFWTYTGSVRALDPASATLTVLKSETASGDSGAVVTEIAVQTTTPYSWFAAVDGPVSGALYKINAPGTAVANLTTYKSSPYTSPSGDAAVNGIISNLLFVASSGSAGGNLWADRLYWMGSAAAASDARFIQLGVPGTWSVVGTFEGALTNLGEVDALGDFDVDYSGDIQYAVANGAAGPFADTDFIPVAPNQRLTISSSAPEPYIQWTSTLTWNYTVASPTESPYFNFVSVGYFLGDNNIPSVASVHYKGRTRWAVAESGEDDNNLEVVYQKNNKWTTCPNRNIVSYAVFRGELLAFVDYTLVRMEKGSTWLGAPVEPLAVTGYIMDTLQDKYIRNLKANVMEYLNSSNPTATGYFMVVPIAAGADLDASQWYVPIPATAGPDTFPKQVVGVMETFSQKWVRAMALKITRSDSTGDYQPVGSQVMDVQALIIDIRMSVPRDLIPVN